MYHCLPAITRQIAVYLNSNIQSRQTRFCNFNITSPRYNRQTKRARTFTVWIVMNIIFFMVQQNLQYVDHLVYFYSLVLCILSCLSNLSFHYVFVRYLKGPQVYQLWLFHVYPHYLTFLLTFYELATHRHLVTLLLSSKY